MSGFHPRFVVGPETLGILSRLDLLRGVWSAGPVISRERLERVAEAARIQSVGASCRLAGLRVSDVDVAGLLRGEAVPQRDAAEILGYARALDQPLTGQERLLAPDDLGRLHRLMMGGTAEPGESSPWRSSPMQREAFDGEGRATGRVFSTLPPRLVADKTEDVLTWLEFELRTAEQHSLLVIGAFLVLFLVISPFERGNGRLMRLLAGLLLRRAGYGFIRYGSLEREIEEQREAYNDAFDKAHTRIWTEDADLTPWLDFFVGALDRQRERIEAKIEIEREVEDFPPLQQAILRAVRDHGSVNAALLIEATGANRNTLKDNLRRLVLRGVLEKTGQRRGTRYRIATGGPGTPPVRRVPTRDS